jgi:hypothetical protein
MLRERESGGKVPHSKGKRDLFRQGRNLWSSSATADSSGQESFVGVEERSFVAMLLRTAYPRRISWLTITGYPSPCLSEVFILKGVKVVCFDALLEVLILKKIGKRVVGSE